MNARSLSRSISTAIAGTLAVLLAATLITGCGQGAEMTRDRAAVETPGQTRPQADRPPRDPIALLLVQELERGRSILHVPLDQTGSAATLKSRIAWFEDVSVSPDGDRIAYVTDQMSNSARPGEYGITLRMLDIESGEETTLTTGLEIGSLSWTPESELFVSLWRWRDEETGAVGKIRERRWSLFDGAQERVLCEFEDGNAQPGASVYAVGADEQDLYLLEAEMNWQRPGWYRGVRGIWGVPRTGGEPELLANLWVSPASEVEVQERRLPIDPRLVTFLDPQSHLGPDDSLVIHHSYDTHWHGSAEAVEYVVREYRLRDGEVLSESSATQTLTPSFEAIDVSLGQVLTGDELADPHAPDRSALERYTVEGEAWLVLVEGSTETTIARTSEPHWAAHPRPLTFLPDGDLVFVSAAEDGTAIRRYGSDSGAIELIQQLALPGEYPTPVSLIGYVY